MAKRSAWAALALLSVVLTCPVAAETVRLGVLAGVELLNQPSYGDLLDAFDSQADIIPGFSWEVLTGNVGIGMSALAQFNRTSGDAAWGEYDYDWYVDWIGSFDLRYHFVKRFILDPFVEAGVGSAGRVHISGYQDDPLNLSLFCQVGGGLAVRLSGLYLGARVLYRPMNSPIPATSFNVYPLKSFHVDLFVGVGL